MSKEFEDYIKDDLTTNDAINGGRRLKVDAVFAPALIDIGTVDIDQTTPGTTNGVVSKAIAQDVSALPTRTLNSYYPLIVDENNGILPVEQGLLDWQLGDTLTSYAPLASAVNIPSISSSTTVLSALATRQSFTIQNLGTNPLYVRLAASASTTVFHVVLKAGSVNDDGTGGTYYSDEHAGVVSCAGTSPRYTVTELTR